MPSFVPSTPTSAVYWDLQWKSLLFEGLDITKSTAPEKPFVLQAEQAQLPQALLTGQVLQPPSSW